MARPANFAGFTLYRIYYGDKIVYLGRTMQPLQNRIRGHLFKKPMHREINIDLVSKIEYATFQSMADMYLYEIYFINLWHPALNKDDEASDALTVSLPEVDWQLFTTPLWEKWKREIVEKNIVHQEKKTAKLVVFEEIHPEMRRKRRCGEITEEQFDAFVEEMGVCRKNGDYRPLMRFVAAGKGETL